MFTFVWILILLITCDRRMIVDSLAPYSEEKIHPGFSVDCVVLSFHKGKLKVLLRDFGVNSYWALPGGFVFNDESADQAALRILKNHTGIEHVFLRQFHLFSDPDRTILTQNVDFVARHKTPDNDGKWLLRRFISMGYYALVKHEDVLIADADKKRLKWYDIFHLPDMYSDHEHIIKEALQMLRITHPVVPIGGELLPERFTMGNLRKIYEIILGKELDRRNFQRKILAEGIVVPLEETSNENTYNAAIMYKFKTKEAKATFV